MGKSDTEANAAIIKAVKANHTMKESCSLGLIISYFKEPMSSLSKEIHEDDIKEIRNIMKAIKIPVPIKKVYRMKRKPTVKDSTKPRTAAPLVAKLHRDKKSGLSR